MKTLSRCLLGVSTSRPGKTNDFLEPNMVVKNNGFVTFFSRLFSFSVSSAKGRNFGPICPLNGSKVVFRLIYMTFEGLVLSNSL